MYYEWIREYSALLVQLHGAFNKNTDDLRLSYSMLEPTEKDVKAQYEAIRTELSMTLYTEATVTLKKIMAS